MILAGLWAVGLAQGDDIDAQKNMTGNRNSFHARVEYCAAFCLPFSLQIGIPRQTPCSILITESDHKIAKGIDASLLLDSP